MKRALITLLAIVAIAGTLWAQTTYIMLGTYNHMSYEVEAMPKLETAKTRNTFIEGDYKDYSLVTTWLYDCPGESIKETHRVFIGPDGKVLKEEDVVGEWMKVEKGSFGRQALDQFWCRNIL